MSQRTIYILIAVVVIGIVLFIIFKDKILNNKISSSTTVSTSTPTSSSTDAYVFDNQSAFTGGFKWDAIEKKCYGLNGNSQSWVNTQECTSRGILTT